LKICAIISEYNPFHLGHEYQIKRIREELGPDTAIIAIMSGSFTQRGESAIADKRTRAACATLCGVNLVLELPFPHSISSAEYFASGAVHIINSLGCVDYLSFGSENGDIEKIVKVAKIMLTDEFNTARGAISDKAIGYARAQELALSTVCREVDFEFTPNNILALEYIKALIRTNSSVLPHTVKREGLGFNEAVPKSGVLPSATAVRGLMNNGTAFEQCLPSPTLPYIKDAYEAGDMPCDVSRLDTAVISYFRLNPTPSETLADLGDGLYYRIREASLDANTIKDLLMLTKTKKYTDAKIRRDIWYAFFGVTSSDKSNLPHYTQILAMDDVGKSLLRSFVGKSSIPILTKPSDTSGLDEVALRQKALTDRADAIFDLTKPMPKSARDGIRMTPFIK